MSATIARQGCRVQLKQSDMCPVLNMAKMTNGGILRAAVEEMQYVIKKPHAEVRTKNTRGIEFTGHIRLKAAIVRQPAMVCQIQTDGFFPCQHGGAKNPLIHWRCKGTDAPPLQRRRQMTPEPMPPLPETTPLPGMPPARPSNNAGAQRSQIANVLARCACSHTALPCAEWFTLDTSAQDSKHDTDFDPDVVTDKGPATGYYTICCGVMQLTLILKTTAAY